MIMTRENAPFKFEIDTLLLNNPDVSTFGLNLAMVWPFPASARSEYEAIAGELRLLDTGLYVYPYDETHITAMTLIDFRKHLQPDASYLAKTEQTIARIPPCLKNIFDAYKYSSALTLKFDKAVLSGRAVYLEFHDPDRVIGQLRDSLAGPLRDLGLEAKYPSIVHSTVARFLKEPVSSSTLSDRFAEIASKFSLSDFNIDEILLTAELKPYMRQGKILARFPIVDK